MTEQSDPQPEVCSAHGLRVDPRLGTCTLCRRRQNPPAKVPPVALEIRPRVVRGAAVALAGVALVCAAYALWPRERAIRVGGDKPEAVERCVRQMETCLEPYQAQRVRGGGSCLANMSACLGASDVSFASDWGEASELLAEGPAPAASALVTALSSLINPLQACRAIAGGKNVGDIYVRMSIEGVSGTVGSVTVSSPINLGVDACIEEALRGRSLGQASDDYVWVAVAHMPRVDVTLPQPADVQLPSSEPAAPGIGLRK